MKRNYFEIIANLHVYPLKNAITLGFPAEVDMHNHVIDEIVAFRVHMAKKHWFLNTIIQQI